MNCFAAKRRQKVAQGVSPGKTYRGIEQPPEGAAEYCALSGLFAAISSDPGLTPWATVVDAASGLDWQTGQFVHSCNESVAVSPLDPLRTFIVHFEPRLMRVFIDRRYSGRA